MLQTYFECIVNRGAFKRAFSFHHHMPGFKLDCHYIIAQFLASLTGFFFCIWSVICRTQWEITQEARNS